MIKIREIKARDRANIYQLIQQDDTFKSGELEAILHRIDLYLFDSNQRLYKGIVAEDEEKELLGYALYGPDPQATGTFQIYNIAHSPILSNGEVLNYLLLFIENELLKYKSRIIIFELSSNFKYRNHYETFLNHNFNLSSRLKNFYSEGEDKLILSKNIS